MKYTMREKEDGSHELLRHGKAVDGSPSNAEIEFWLELEELRSKLPHTADGVPITPGMRLWEVRELEDGEGEGEEKPSMRFVTAVSNPMIQTENPPSLAGGLSIRMGGSRLVNCNNLYHSKEACWQQISVMLTCVAEAAKTESIALHEKAERARELAAGSESVKPISSSPQH